MKKNTAADALSGNFGAHTLTSAYILRGIVHFEYNSTTLDLVIQAEAAGAKVGDKLITPGLGGNTNRWEITPTGGGDRTPDGIWVEKMG